MLAIHWAIDVAMARQSNNIFADMWFLPRNILVAMEKLLNLFGTWLSHSIRSVNQCFHFPSFTFDKLHNITIPSGYNQGNEALEQSNMSTPPIGLFADGGQPKFRSVDPFGHARLPSKTWSRVIDCGHDGTFDQLYQNLFLREVYTQHAFSLWNDEE